MTIILPFPGGVTAYLIEIAGWYWKECCCPLCQGGTHRQGKYLRCVYSETECFVIPIFRRYCPHCRVSFSFIPSFIKPYARFFNSYRHGLFERHLLQKTSLKQTPAQSAGPGLNSVSITTFRRWLKRLKDTATKANIQLVGQLLGFQPGLILPKTTSSGPGLLLWAGKLIHSIASAFLPDVPVESLGVFDVLNLILPADLWV